ncbi:MAG TPA: serine hydrolase domain-containing protein [Propionibacteriaceae bacterium]|nr:serine hydrolase domain-containing protein [Propionibacteriaceae bacterium]
MKKRTRVVLGLAIPAAIVGGLLTRTFGAGPIESEEQAVSYLDSVAGSQVPGLQYVVVTANEVEFDYAGGWADIGQKRPMTNDTTLMAFSMTKTFTAAAVLQLVERGVIGLDDELDRYLPTGSYAGQGITIRHLLTHTAGLPNPIPLRWVHLTEDEDSFDEAAALEAVTAANPKLDARPGEKYSYTNIGYWLLGKVIETATGESYAEYVTSNILVPLGVDGQVAIGIPDAGNHASGYLARYSFTNLLKGLVTDGKFWGEYEGDWLRIKNHHLNGPAFGGLVGSARSFSRFLQDQLAAESALFSADTKELLQAAQTNSAGEAVPMTLGWHVGEVNGERYLFKEGGGGGFHAEMRIYPERGVGTVVMVSNTDFDSTGFLNRVDQPFLAAAEGTDQ